MKKSIFAYVLAVMMLVPFQASAYEFLGCGYTVTGYDNNNCPQGDYDNGGNCGCSANAAPKWQSGLLNMVVENQGNNTVSGSQFVDIAQYGADAWSQISCSSAILNISGTIAANNDAVWGTNSSSQALYMITGTQEWIQVTGSGAGGTLGVTLAPYGGWNCDNRSFSDADIIINGFNGQGYSQLRATVLHEMGHALGLGHPCLGVYSGCSNSCAAVMAATGDDSYGYPQQDDINGLCALYPGQPGQLGSSCDNNSDCASGFSCINYEGVSYCSQTCGDCPSGYECENVGGTDYCVREGLPAPGEPCASVCQEGAICLGDPNTGDGVCFYECNPNASNTGCPDSYRCIGFDEPSGSGPQGYCLESAGPGQDCNATGGVCIDGFVCVSDGAGETPTCHRSCDVSNDDCPSGYGCMALQDGSGACFELGSAGEGENCWNATDCSEGLVCVGSGIVGQCYYECDPSNPDCPLAGQTCTELQGVDYGICQPVGGTDGSTGGGGTDGSGGTGGDGTDTGNGSGTGGGTSGGTDGGSTSGCSCDTTYSCNFAGDGCTFCQCDVECVPCACDKTYACDDNCACDVECIEESCSGDTCVCDTTFGCESDCFCDLECREKSGCASGPYTNSGMGILFLMLGLLAVWRIRLRGSAV
ncbi:MAG: hypothetical protein HOI23_06015 [Deltaproteobacteria bacterium]|jgi:hypothetical protein|nr:hypothetical protein [Deltaproteobacteria bacterium]MBT6434173.1 hypothetical protein [Deltaproteobacteria bacterium]MBT6490538.1 hypothetical protein [Deltaproteobacteria bacterium]